MDCYSYTLSSTFKLIKIYMNANIMKCYFSKIKNELNF